MTSLAEVHALQEELRDVIGASWRLDGEATTAVTRYLVRLPASADIGIDAATARVVEIALARAQPAFWIEMDGSRGLVWQEDSKRFRAAVAEVLRNRGMAGSPEPPEPPESPGSTATPESSDTMSRQVVQAMSGDGHMRQEAVAWLVASGSAVAFPVLALRAADWVPAVRYSARTALSAALDANTNGTTLAHVAPVALSIEKRHHGRWLADEVRTRLAGANSWSAIHQLLHGRNQRLRRTAVPAVLDSGKLSLAMTMELALRDEDPVVQTAAAASAIRLATSLGEDRRRTVVLRLVSGNIAPVRIEALKALSHDADVAGLWKALTDTSAAVRQAARTHLGPLGVDMAGHYRSLLEAGGEAVTPAAVAGLAETTDTSHGAEDHLLIPLLRHPRVKVRSAAIRALRCGAVGLDTDLMLGLIEHDPSPSVRELVLAVLLDRRPAWDPARVLALLDPGRPRSVRLAARILLADLGDAWRVAVDVSLLADADRLVAGTAKTDLITLLHRSLHGRPDRGVPGELMAAHLADADRLLSPADARLLRFSCGLPWQAPGAGE